MAAYVEYNRSFTFGTFTAGLRYEHVGFGFYKDGQRSKDQSRRYDDLFPNLSFSTSIGGLQLQAPYTVKIERPGYRYLSNNVSYINRFTLQTGNPALKPTVVHDLSLTAAWQCLTGMVSYQCRTDDMIYWGEQMAGDQAVTMVGNKNVACIPMLTAYAGAMPTVGCWSPDIGLGVSKQWFTLETAVGRMPMNRPMWTARWGNDLFHSRKDGNVVRVDRLCVDQHNVINSRAFLVTLRYKFNSAKNKYKGKGAGQDEIKRF